MAGGGPSLKGSTMSEKRQDFLANWDWVRTSLMFEPRGHDVMSGSILYPPTTEDGDVAILFIETSGCLPMCGHGTIGTVTMAIEQGHVVPKEEGRLLLDVPAGRVVAEYVREGRFVEKVKLTNVPSYLAMTEVHVDCPELGELVVDIGYGGNFYAIVEPQKNLRDMADLSAGEIQRLSPELRRRLRALVEPVHPLDDTIRGVSHILWTGKPTRRGAHARNAVFYGDKAIDRSPCGTGTSARMAQLVAKGRLNVGDPFVHESIIGSMFEGRVEAATELAGVAAIVPSIAGWARTTGYNTIIVDDRDPFWRGFSVI
ncbi:MAG TPA: 4-hydroxyproline epimerase [Geminicoccus sp.]|nr:4-hydroxyproline epimerase [Geminicoccus sp.]HEX2524937.1 4-hydroxyproline epimerase [Geminicoccus sp.]